MFCTEQRIYDLK